MKRKKKKNILSFRANFLSFFFFLFIRSERRVSESQVARSLEKECFNWRHRQRRELVRSFVRQICIRRKVARVAGKGWRERYRVAQRKGEGPVARLHSLFKAMLGESRRFKAYARCIRDLLALINRAAR